MHAERPAAHVRVGVVRAGRRINDHRGDAGRALCGGELTAYDVDLRYARRATADELRQFPICAACLEAARKEVW
jgi:hypothetical protein